MGEDRLRLLCCWGYSRAEWVAPLEALGADHGFDLTYLFHRRLEEETAVATVWPRRYWREFRDAHQVLDELAPDRIVFMGLDGAWTIALNAVARRRGIPTFLLQHGIVWPPVYASAGWGTADLGTEGGRRAGVAARLPALRFLSRSLRRRPAIAVRTIRLLRAATRVGLVHAAPTRVFAARQPTLHLVTGIASALAVVAGDGAAPSEIVAVGLPELSVQRGGAHDFDRRDTVLVIDTPQTGGPDRPATISGHEKGAAFAALGRGLREATGLMLRVKLHPYSFGDTWARDTADVNYLRQVDVAAEVARAAVVVGFDSTLVLAALGLRPVVLARTEPSWFTDLAVALDAAPVVEGLMALTVDSLLETAAAGPAPGADALLEAFAGPPPWSVEPLARAIRDPTTAARIEPTELERMQRTLTAATRADRSSLSPGRTGRRAGDDA